MEEKKRDSTTAMGTKGTKIMIQGKMPQYYFSQQGLPCRMKIIENIVRNKIKCTALSFGLTFTLKVISDIHLGHLI